MGEYVTLVQAKRYAKKYPIGLEAVSALAAIVDDEKANRGLFVTTSRFLPGAQRFAARQNKRLVLAGPSQLVEWCREIANRLSGADHQLSLNQIRHSLQDKAAMLVKAHDIACSRVRFAVVLRQVGDIIRMREVKTTHDNLAAAPLVVDGVPQLDAQRSDILFARATDRPDQFWGDCDLWEPWDETPVTIDPYWP